jgi:hypothetical protein
VDAAEALAVLGLREETDLTGVRAAYRGLVRAAHPDVAPGDEDAHARTARLTQAYEVIVAFVEEHGTTPAPPAPEPGPQPEHGPATTGGEDDPTDPDVVIEALDEGTIAVALPTPETYAVLHEAAGRVGEVTYYDRQLGILEIIVRFEGGPSCSVVMTLQGRSHHTEVFCTMESIESAPTPPITPVIHALVAELRAR